MATDGMPISRNVRAIRTAISPRFAISTFRNNGSVSVKRFLMDSRTAPDSVEGCGGRQGTSSTFATQLGQTGNDCSGVDFVTLADQDLRDRPVALGGDWNLHLHRLQGHDRIT